MPFAYSKQPLTLVDSKKSLTELKNYERLKISEHLIDKTSTDHHVHHVDNVDYDFDEISKTSLFSLSSSVKEEFSDSISSTSSEILSLLSSDFDDTSNSSCSYVSNISCDDF